MNFSGKKNKKHTNQIYTRNICAKYKKNIKINYLNRFLKEKKSVAVIFCLKYKHILLNTTNF